jgi:hypothetical protein
VLIIEGASNFETRKNAAPDGFEASIPKTRIPIAKSEDKTSNPGGGNDASALFNGTTRNADGKPETRDDGKTFRGYGTGDTLTITLDTTGTHGGYDIAEIRTFAGHSDARASQAYTLLAATAHEPTKFQPVETIKLPTTGGATEARILAPEKLRGIVALKFEFTDGALGYNLYREISVVGAAGHGH